MGIKRKSPSECVTDYLEPPIINLTTNPASIHQCDPAHNVKDVEKKTSVRIFQKATEYLQEYKY